MDEKSNQTHHDGETPAVAKTSISREEYQRIKKRSTTQPWGAPDEPANPSNITIIELESHDNNNNNNNNNSTPSAGGSSQKEGNSNVNNATETQAETRAARLYSMSVDTGSSSYALQGNNHRHLDFLQSLTMNLNQSLQQGLDGLAMIGSFNVHESRLAKLNESMGSSLYINQTSNDKSGRAARGSIDLNDPKLTSNKQPLLASHELEDGGSGFDHGHGIAANATKCTFAETCLNTLQYMVGINMLCMPYVVSIGGSVELIILAVISICSLLTALMIDEL